MDVSREASGTPTPARRDPRFEAIKAECFAKNPRGVRLIAKDPHMVASVVAGYLCFATASALKTWIESAGKLLPLTSRDRTPLTPCACGLETSSVSHWRVHC